MDSKVRNHTLLCCSLFFLILAGHSHSLSDKLYQGQVLEDGDQLVSAFGSFRLAFFSPPPSTKRYIGIWYHKSDDKRPVWVANRDTPLLDKSGRLVVDAKDGNLKILQGGGNPIAISYLVQNNASTNASATLMSSGNFVLHELNPDGTIKRVLWQSFDYPTDTLLPGMKLGINLQTGHQWSLQSWLTKDSPAQGIFTLGVDRNATDRLRIWWQRQVLADSGPLLNDNSFTHDFDNSNWSILSSDYNFSYTSNGKEKYFKYSALEFLGPFPSLRINPGGEFETYVGVIFSAINDPVCSTGYSSVFKISPAAITENGFIFKEDNMTLDDCKMRCRYNCSCIAFASLDFENKTGCRTWSEGAKFVENSYLDWHVYTRQEQTRDRGEF